MGRVVDHMRADRPDTSVFTIYIGNDNTDEDAFRVLPAAGLGIVIGEQRFCSATHYAIESAKHIAKCLAVFSALAWLIPQPE